MWIVTSCSYKEFKELLCMISSSSICWYKWYRCTLSEVEERNSYKLLFAIKAFHGKPRLWGGFFVQVAFKQSLWLILTPSACCDAYFLPRGAVRFAKVGSNLSNLVQVSKASVTVLERRTDLSWHLQGIPLQETPAVEAYLFPSDRLGDGSGMRTNSYISMSWRWKVSRRPSISGWPRCRARESRFCPTTPW